MVAPRLHHSIVALLVASLLLVLATVAPAAVRVITSGERNEEIQFILDGAGVHPEACTAAFEWHIMVKDGYLTMCVEEPSATGTYQYFALAAIPPTDSPDATAQGYDFGDPNQAWRDGWFSRDFNIIDTDSTPGVDESPVSLTIKSQASESDSNDAGVVIHGGAAENSLSASIPNRGLIRPTELTSANRPVNLGSDDYRFQHIFLDSAAEITQGAPGSEVSNFNFHLAANGSIESENNNAVMDYPRYQIRETGSTATNRGVVGDWYSEQGDDVGNTCASNVDLGLDPNVTSPVENRWRDLWVCRDANIGGDLDVTGTITGTFDEDCLTSSLPTTFCLTDDGTDQTLTGNAGTLRLDSSGGTFGLGAAPDSVGTLRLAGGIEITRQPNAFGMTSNNAAFLMLPNDATGITAALFAIGRANPANEPFVGFTGWDDPNVDRHLSFGGGGWEVPDATLIEFYVAPTYTETNDTGVVALEIIGGTDKTLKLGSFTNLDFTNSATGFIGDIIPDSTAGNPSIGASGKAFRRIGNFVGTNLDINTQLAHTGSGGTVGFFAVTPAVRQGATTDIKDALTTYGLLQGTSATPLNLDGGKLTADEVEIDGALNHDGSTIGFFGATPTVKAVSTADLKDLFVVYGLLTDGGATPLDLDGGDATVDDLILEGDGLVHGLLKHETYTYLDPNSGDEATIWWEDYPITIIKTTSVIVGGTSIDWDVKHDPDRSAGGNSLQGGATTESSTTTGTTDATFFDPSVDANSFVWLELTSEVGTVEEFHITIYYTYN